MQHDNKIPAFAGMTYPYVTIRLPTLSLLVTSAAAQRHRVLYATMTDEMTEKMTPLRRQIDTLDDQLIDLLKERIAVVHQVGELKREHLGDDHCFIRSGREGTMVHRIYDAFKDNEFNALAAVSIWRQIIGASIHLESPLTISAYYQPGMSALYWLAREHFGQAIPIQTVSTPSRVLGDLYEKRASVGILPMPGQGDESRWWRLIDHTRPDVAPKLFARLPVADVDHYPKHFPTALAVAMVAPEPSDNDISYFMLSVDGTISTSRISSVFDSAGIPMTIVDVDADDTAMRHLLISLPGFYDHQVPALQTVREQLDESLHQLEWLGAHPTPIDARAGE